MENKSAVFQVSGKSLQQQHMAGLLVSGFLLTVILRVVIGGVGVARSPIAGLLFALILLAFCGAYGLSFKITTKSIVIGVVGALVLCFPALVQAISSTTTHPAGNYLYWGIVVSVVAMAEEVFLRGVLFDAATNWQGEKSAVLLTALLFAILHIPLYGWHSVPLNFVVGVWLGFLRISSGSWIAPGIAHTLADLASWWLV